MEDPMGSLKKRNEEDEPLHIGFKVASFLVPIVGIILFFMFRNEKPNKSKDAGIAALLGMGMNLIIHFINRSMS